jgi:hypothetical protein
MEHPASLGTSASTPARLGAPAIACLAVLGLGFCGATAVAANVLNHGGVQALPLHVVAGLGAIGWLIAAWTLIRWGSSWRGRAAAFRTWLPVRVFLYAGLCGFAVATVGQWRGLDGAVNLRSLFFSATLLATGAAATWITRRPQDFSAGLRGWRRGVDLFLFNSMLLALALEAALTLYAPHSASPLFWDQSSVLSAIDKYRGKPGSRYFGFPLNSGGYHDAEFFPAEKDDLVVALIGDSFAYGIVPYAQNYATLAEKRLQAEAGENYKRVAIHNFGIPCLGMRHYAWILEREALAYKPACVALCVFVGNDIDGMRRPRRHRYCLQNWWIWEIARRVLAVRAEAGVQEGVATLGAEEMPASAGADLPEEKEKPHLTEGRFYEIERGALEFCRAGARETEESYRGFFEGLDYFRDRLGDRLFVILIPDSLQVNDEIWRTLLAGAKEPKAYDRDLPQKRIGAFCRDKGIRLLDLLEPLRQAEAGGRTYHLLDTHWNARGNRIAGEALGHALAEREKEGRKAQR